MTGLTTHLSGRFIAQHSLPVGRASRPARVLQNPLFGERSSPTRRFSQPKATIMRRSSPPIRGDAPGAASASIARFLCVWTVHDAPAPKLAATLALPSWQGSLSGLPHKPLQHPPTGPLTLAPASARPQRSSPPAALAATR